MTHQFRVSGLAGRNIDNVSIGELIADVIKQSSGMAAMPLGDVTVAVAIGPLQAPLMAALEQAAAAVKAIESAGGETAQAPCGCAACMKKPIGQTTVGDLLEGMAKNNSPHVLATADNVAVVVAVGPWAQLLAHAYDAMKTSAKILGVARGFH